MQTHTKNLTRLDVAGSTRKSEEISNSMLRRWGERLGYCSLVAAVPAVLASTLPATSNAEGESAKTNIPGSSVRFSEKLSLTASKRALLRRQSEFRLPHQKGVTPVLTPTGADECPGAPIPGGTYTVASPLVVNGDTTGANNTVNELLGYYYYFFGNYAASGPDNVYSFVLSSVGPDAQIEVTTTSSTFKPLIYLLDGTVGASSCPAGTGNLQSNWWFIEDSRWRPGSNTATVKIDWMPVNHPFYLFVDSAHADNAGAGTYTLKIRDVTVAPAPACSLPNPIECQGFFVRQQYLDFLDREPDPVGFQNWIDTLASCPNGGFGEFNCPQSDRVHVSASFVQSNEFQGRGYWLLRFGYVGLNRSVGSVRSSLNYGEFIPALQQIGGQNSPAQEEAAKVVYANAFVQRPDFLALFPNSLTNSQYVDALESNAGVTLTNKTQLVTALNSGGMTRAEALRNVVESQVVFDKYIIPSFVDMEYKGYLRRDPDTIGYQNWVNTLTADPSNYRHMVFGFIYSGEYRSRFGPQ
jgi:Domain of unknown function (DUF4214)